MDEKKYKLMKKNIAQIMKFPNTGPFYEVTNDQVIHMFNEMGHQTPFTRINQFKKRSSPDIWNFLFGIFLHCLTSRSDGLDKAELEIYALIVGLYYDLNVDYVSQLWEEFETVKELCEVAKERRILFVEEVKKVQDYVTLKVESLRSEMSKEVNKLEHSHLSLHTKLDVVTQAIHKVVENFTTFSTKDSQDLLSQMFSSLESNLKAELAPLLKIVNFDANRCPTYYNRGARRTKGCWFIKRS
ncbi:unnamed protein product [Lactuca saligna]|uniref:Uncharacterized protein n=1 Tax=Lactuca saligna TaxID=75948 RepID=A0AA36EG72_LACSI|nr:unnamed protein product [Lactuca saligna]